MKKLRKLDLASLAKKEMEDLKGGACACTCDWGCGCACAYSGDGGSSTSDNACANADGGLRSPNRSVC